MMFFDDVKAEVTKKIIEEVKVLAASFDPAVDVLEVENYSVIRKYKDNL